MNMRRTPRVGVVAPGVRARLDRKKLVAAIRVGQCAPTATEIRIERRVVLIHFVQITPGRIRLPYFNQRAAHRPAAFVQHSTTHRDSFAEWRTRMLRGQIAIIRTDAILPEDRSGSL